MDLQKNRKILVIVFAVVVVGIIGYIVYLNTSISFIVQVPSSEEKVDNSNPLPSPPPLTGRVSPSVTEDWITTSDFSVVSKFEFKSPVKLTIVTGGDGGSAVYEVDDKSYLLIISCGYPGDDLSSEEFGKFYGKDPGVIFVDKYFTRVSEGPSESIGYSYQFGAKVLYSPVGACYISMLLKNSSDRAALLSVFDGILSTFKFKGERLEVNIDLLSPNGGEKLFRGKDFVIKWKVGNKAPLSSQNILISIYDYTPGKHSTTVFKKNYGPIFLKESLNWTVPIDLKVGNYYSMNIGVCPKASQMGHDGCSTDNSLDYFAVQ